MRILTKEQFELLEMMVDVDKLRHFPGAARALTSLEEFGLIGPDFKITAEGLAILRAQRPDRVRRRVH